MTTWVLGNSPGTMHVDAGSFANGPGGRIILEIAALPGGDFATDKWVFGPGTQLDFDDGEIVFSFLGDTGPNAFQDSGLFDLETFLFIDDGQGTLRRLGSSLFDGTAFSVRADVYRFDRFTFSPIGGAAFVAGAVPVPAPLALAGIGVLALVLTGRRRAGASAPACRSCAP